MNAASDPGKAKLTSLPSGTVTFLFTDIEGSTRAWEVHAPAMQAALREHDVLLRTTIEQHAGHVFKTIGDAFCAAFGRPDDALVAACEAQRAFGVLGKTGADLHVRMALHSGSTDERDGDYFGPPLNRVARLLASAHGGQIVVSNATSELARDLLPHDYTLRDLGSHRFKDLGRPERIFQLVAPGLRDAFPALRSLPDRAHNLPLQLTSFIGREAELADIGRSLRTQRLTTLVGAGGVGKTRAALYVGANVVEEFPGGVWLVELAPLGDAASIPAAIATAVGIDLPPNADPIEALAAALAPKKLLLILDNCEHVIDAVARIAAAILRSCANVTLLATSRQGLGINGESAYRLPTLSLPSMKASEHIRVDEALQYDAIALFAERAHAVDATFVLETQNVRTVTDICRRLDGIALALELAAARIRMFGPEQLRDRLDERFRLLTAGKRDALPRQQTIRALIDWSYDLLDERERTLFRAVAIFSDGFSLEAASAVGTTAASDEFDVVDDIASLVDKSLVVADHAGDTMRFRLLETTRAYALEKLRESGEAKNLAERHLRYFETFAVAASDAYESSGSDVSLRPLAGEFDNIRTALRWSLDGGDVRAGAVLAAKTQSIWRQFGASAEGIAHAEQLAAKLADREVGLRAALWNGVSMLAYLTARSSQALEAAERAVGCAREAAATRLLIDALLHRARAAMFLGRFDAGEADVDEAGALDDGAAVSLQRAEVMKGRGVLHCWREDYPLASDTFRELRALYRALANDEGELNAASILAECEHACGRTVAAIEVARNVLPRMPALGKTLHANVLSNLAGYLAAVDAVEEANSFAREAVVMLAESDPAAPTMAYAIEQFALTLALADEPARAARLFGYTDAALRRDGMLRQYTERRSCDRLVSVLRQKLPAEALSRELQHGAALSRHDAIQTVLAPSPSPSPS